ncbi:MAG: hypothetical protein AVDCRST_MAG87-2125, partial [uncultured Thermomicrobiales bacterium]
GPALVRFLLPRRVLRALPVAWRRACTDPARVPVRRAADQLRRSPPGRV